MFIASKTNSIARNRHSIIVAWAKVILPILALALLSMLFLFVRAPTPDVPPAFVDPDQQSALIEQNLSQPRFSSTLDDGRQVTLSAVSMSQSPATPNRIFLQSVELEMEMSALDQALLTAENGQINLAQQMVDLQGDVTFVTENGYQVFSDAMSIDLQGGRMIAPGPVFARGSAFQIRAGGMEFSGPRAAAILRFTDGVQMLYDPKQ